MMRIELLDAENNVLSMIDTSDPASEVEFYGPQIGAVAWREYQAPALDLEQVRLQVLEKIDAWTRKAIVGGFDSSANGLPHRYDSENNDQDNLKLMQAVSHSVRFATHPVYQGRIPIRAIPAGQSKKTVLYLDTNQMDLLLEDLSLHIGACKVEGWRLQGKAAAAETVEALEAIAWGAA